MKDFLLFFFFFFFSNSFFVISLCITYVFTSLNPTVYILPVSVLFLFLFVFLGSGPLHLVYFVLFASLVSSQVLSFVFLRLCYTYVFFFSLKPLCTCLQITHTSLFWAIAITFRSKAFIFHENVFRTEDFVLNSLSVTWEDHFFFCLIQKKQTKQERLVRKRPFIASQNKFI